MLKSWRLNTLRRGSTTVSGQHVLHPKATGSSVTIYTQQIGAFLTCQLKRHDLCYVLRAPAVLATPLLQPR